MQLAQLHMVKQILETGSLSKTALRMNWAQSVVSRQLAAFERECGGRIFYRNGRGVVLTELGERILPRIDTIIAAAEDIACSGVQPHELAGEVKIAVSPQIAPLLSGPLFARLRELHPNIRLSLWEAFSGTKVDLREGRVDIAVFMRVSSAMRPDEQLIGAFDTYLVGLPDSPATAGDTIGFAQLQGLPLLLPSLANAWRRALEHSAARDRIALTSAVEVNDPAPTAAFVHAGIGYMISPLATGAAAARMGWIGADVHAGRLQATRIVDAGFTSKLIVGCGPNRRRSVDVVARMAEQILTELMPVEA